MQDTLSIVTAFLTECGKSEASMQEAFRAYFTATTVWENVGMATTTGVDEALALLRDFKSTMGAAFLSAEILAVACQDNQVLTERIDHLRDSDGKSLKTVRLMGIFEVEDGRITAWRDYFDTAIFANV